MIIASAHTAPRSVIELGWDAPSTEDEVLAHLSRTLVALEPDLRPLRCTLTAFASSAPSECAAPICRTLRAAARSSPPATISEGAATRDALPSLTTAAIVSAARELLSPVHGTVTQPLVLACVEVDALLLRVPAEVIADRDVTLETWSGPRWVSLRDGGSFIGFEGPSEDGAVPSPGLLRIERLPGCLGLSLLVQWSLWSERGAPARSVIDGIACRLEELGWEGH